MNYGFSERRNKGKWKKKENRKHPYRKGGKQRVREKKQKVLSFLF